jgi:GTPase SAR1 family protein
MANWFNKIKPQKTEDSKTDSASLTLRVIGDRASGKTTYLAALVYHPNSNSASPVQVINPFNDDGKKLVTLAQNILEQGLQLEPTRLDELPDYRLTIILKRQSSWRNPQSTANSSLITLSIDCKDYSGEFFTDLLHRQGDALLREYINDCSQAEGILFLVDGIAYRRDAEYAKGLDIFLDTWGQSAQKNQPYRLALVLTKCEQPDLWINRHKPRDLTLARFPKVYKKLETWQQLDKGKVEYFASSAFGTLGTRSPEANSKQIRRDKEGVASVLKEPKLWRPFGLIAPIYWLSTGDRHPGLEGD